MADLFTSALSGMNAAQMGLATTEHNIANASTPGYTRQQIQLSASSGQQTGGSGGFVGQGVDVTGVVRIYDQYLSTQILQEQNQASYLTAYQSSMTQINNMLADPAAGASPVMQGFFDSLNGVASNPELVPARQTLLGSAQSVVNRFQSISQHLTDIGNSLTNQITNSVSSINTYAIEIAALNSSIKKAMALSNGKQAPNDLLDQRGQVISQLSKEINVSVQTQSDGTANVFIGSGQALVIGERTMSLRLVQSTADPSKVDIAYQDVNKLMPLQQSSLQGGSLGAYLAFRDQSLGSARNALGLVALGLADNINKQNQMGQDLNGALGGSIFNVASPSVGSGALNTGAAIVTAAISDVSKLTTSDYRLSYDGSHYSMLRLSDNAVTDLGTALPLAATDGVTVTVAGTMAAGDTFLIRPTANAARDISMLTSDPAKIAAAAPIRTTAALANIGSASISAGTVNAPLPLNANLQSPVSIVFDTPPTTFTVTGAVPAVVGSVAYTSGADISYNGWTLQITGTPSAGDTFNVARNTNATGDNRNALLLSGLQTQNLLANGTASLQNTYGQLVAEVGAKTSELNVTSLAQNNMLAQTVAAQQAVSGVNLDEEAAHLMLYQKAYQAAAKAMQIASTMFDAILSIGK